MKVRLKFNHQIKK